MNTIKYFLFSFFLLIILMISFCKPVSGQDKFNLSAGVGLPEFLNLGVRYQIPQAQFGFNVGYLSFKDGESPYETYETLLSASIDAFYHFAGHSKFSKRRPWYGKLGLVMVRDEDDSGINSMIMVNYRLGRDFNISKKIGFTIDMGAATSFFEADILKTVPDNWDFQHYIVTIPSLGFGIFYRI